MVFPWDVAVNGVREPDEPRSNGSISPVKRHWAVVALVAILVLETVALAGAAVYFVIELLVARPTSFASAVGITVIIAIAALWVGFIARGVLRGQSWTRAATVVVQILLIAIAVGSFQGVNPRPDLGFAVLVPAALALVLLFSRPVHAATGNVESEPKTY